MGLQIGRVCVYGLLLLFAPNGAGAQEPDYRLFDAIKGEEFSTVSVLVSDGIDVEMTQPDGATALHWASYQDSETVAVLLLSAGAFVDAENDYGVTPLALACDNGSSTMVKLLLAAGADPRIGRQGGETPLMSCARTGNKDAVSALLRHGADPNTVESWRGQSALMWSVAEGHTGVTEALIKGGADVHIRSKSGFSAILIGSRNDVPEIISLLVSAGADVNDQALDGTTALLVASVRGHVSLAIDLLELGADPNSGASGYTPLHWVSGSWHTELTGPRGIERDREEEWRSLNGLQNRKLELTRALLAYGADPKVRLTRTPPQFGFASQRFRVSLVGATPLLLAAMDGNVAVMEALVAAGADPLLGTDEGSTPLMVAAGLGQVPAESRVDPSDSVDAVKFLLGLGGNVHRTNETGRTALHGAAHIRSDEIVRLLVDWGAEVDVGDERGITPLMIAEGGGHILLPGLGGGSTAELLLELGSREVDRESFVEKYSQGAIR